ncbi:MAG: excinuclease ABC subunit UvrA, partial [Bacteroidota bacterium]
EILLQQGYSRVLIGSELYSLSSLEKGFPADTGGFLYIVIDRIQCKKDQETDQRIADSAEIAMNEGGGICIIYNQGTKESVSFSNRFEEDGIVFEEPNINMFTYNNPIGACQMCEGYGETIGIDPDLVIPDKRLSVFEDAVACWKGEKLSKWKQKVIDTSPESGFPVHKPYHDLSGEQQQLLWNGCRYFKGINAFFRHVEEKAYKIQYRVLLSRYRGKTKCPSCNGSRLKKEASWVKIGSKSLVDLVVMPVKDLIGFFIELELSEQDRKIAGRILTEIRNRLDFLHNVGLGYLTLHRLSSTLSGGESQRINLATSLGSSLVGSMYILDEPSIGLHPRDTEMLTGVLKKLKKLGNTVIVVEHDESIIRTADEIIDIGPEAGLSGGQIVAQGSVEEILADKKGYTAMYLSGKETISIPLTRRKWNNYILLEGAAENNLKDLDVKFPLNTITVVTGVSGSGKSSLVDTVFYRSLKRYYGGSSGKPGKLRRLSGDLHLVHDVELVDQNPIGRSSRSNPVTYIKAYDDIRSLFASQQAAKINGYKPSHFSFNVDGGRCDECQGEGIIRIEMQFMADVHLTCESCKGMRFKEDVLDVRYHGKNIHEVLEMDIDEAIAFFGESGINETRRLCNKLKSLQDAGLGYIKLGQSSSTLSGGESQRVKLASFLCREKANPAIYIFDEPTTGLHFHDIKKLLCSFNALVAQGHTVIIIEHNLEIIKNADWLIDLGPEGGDMGGFIVAEGTPEYISMNPDSSTGKFLSNKLNITS